MSIHVTKVNIHTEDVKTREYQVDDDFMEFILMLKDNGSSQYDSLAYKLMDAMVNSGNANAGIGWTHDSGILFGMSRSKEGSIQQLLKNVEDEGQLAESEVEEIKSLLSSISGAPEMSHVDKNKLRGQAGIERQ